MKTNKDFQNLFVKNTEIFNNNENESRIYQETIGNNEIDLEAPFENGFLINIF